MHLFGPPVILLAADMPPRIQLNTQETRIIILLFLFKFHVFTLSGKVTATYLSTVVSTINRPPQVCWEETTKFLITQEAVVLNVILCGQGTFTANPTNKSNSDTARHIRQNPVEVLCILIFRKVPIVKKFSAIPTGRITMKQYSLMSFEISSSLEKLEGLSFFPLEELCFREMFSDKSISSVTLSMTTEVGLRVSSTSNENLQK